MWFLDDNSFSFSINLLCTNFFFFVLESFYYFDLYVGQDIFSIEINKTEVFIGRNLFFYFIVFTSSKRHKN